MMNSMIKKIPNIPKGIMSPEGERYIGVLLERIEERFEYLKEGFENMETAVERLTGRILRIEERLEGMEADILILKSEAESIRKYLKDATSRKELISISKRVAILEQKTGLA
jgi:prefoldin subunit 5